MFQLRCFSFFLNFLYSFSWMTYSSLPFLCVILVAENGKDCCASPREIACCWSAASKGCVHKVNYIHTLWGTQEKLRIHKAEFGLSLLSMLLSSLDDSSAETGSGVILNIVHCPFFTQKTQVIFIKPQKTERTMSSWSNSAIPQHNKGQKLQRNKQPVGGPSLWYKKVTLKNEKKFNLEFDCSLLH